MNERGYVLDASALLAAMLGEPGAEEVARLLPEARIGAVNLSEVIAKLQERGVPDDAIRESLADLDLDVVPFDSAQAVRAGFLRAATRKAGLSLGDRACLALALENGIPAVTADVGWGVLDVGAELVLIR
ncbi:type II toxin-antitoxin system VapC family toxin [Flavisphingomonas formosensis]|uniref:type II toxin-antitoxin system VapC family toxin n=1 Tax=Flavisphingomonas formosensis TaxID=861534 RepID=UPI0012FB0F04|nr:type II toxin-antitoxin system VapC family toxin [Sphingomonas formosensis]